MHHHTPSGSRRPRRFGSLSVALAFLSGLALGTGAFAQVAGKRAIAQAAVANSDNGPGLGFYDVRLDAEGKPRQAVIDRVTAARAKSRNARGAGIAKLQASVDGLVIDEDPMMGTPRFVRSTRSLLTSGEGQGKLTTREVAASFVAVHTPVFEIDQKEVLAARTDREYTTEHNGVRHATYQQQINGIDLFEAEVRANVTAKGELINIASTMLPRPEGDFQVPAPVFDAGAAIKIAAANVGIVVSSDPVAATAARGASGKQTWATHPDFRADEPITTEMVYFALDRDTIHPAWNVLVPQKGVGHTYEILVDAVDGTILRRHDRLVFDSTQPATFRVYTSDGIAPGSPGTATPTGFQFPLATRSLVTINPSDITPFSPNGWINDGATTTLGNNIDAHTDIDANNVADLPRPDGSAARVFDFPFDPAVSPATQRNASVTQLFYLGNTYHDRLFALGFNEAAGNFQTINFTGQGVGNDAVQADTQDGSGTNNANFSTGGNDGSSARVQMYLFTNPTIARDGSFDGDIVFHEFTHGTSIRLHRGLSGTQPGGMGEGWSDFFGICLLAEPTDDPDAVYSTGGYTTYQLFSPTYFNNYYFGIRRYPYSTDMTKNPLTYRFIDIAQLVYPAGVPRNTGLTGAANEVHNIGEVWCQMLLECRANFWRTYGFSGNQRLLQIVIDGMKLSVANPTLIQARDAIIQADQINNAGANFGLLWSAFAKRGLGFSATSPASSTTSGIVEAFDVPIAANFAYPDGVPTRLLPGVVTNFRVNITGTNLTPTSGTGTLFTSINGGAFTSTPMTLTGTNQYTATIPAQLCSAIVRFYVSTDTSAGVRTDPRTAPTASYRSFITSTITAAVADSFETDTGWTVGPNTATTGLWVRADPVGTGAQPENANSGPGTLCYVTGNAAAGASDGTNDIDGGTTILTSPAYNLSTYNDAEISYFRWYSNGLGANPFTNSFRIEVSVDNGAIWVPAETVGPSNTDPGTAPGWRSARWSLSSLGLTPSATTRVRFLASDLTGALVEAAVDDFAITGFTCTNPPPPPPPCPADFDGVNGITVNDIFSFLAAWFARAPGSDFNNSGTTDVNDIFAFLAAWFVRC